jgi:hypothetical protein
MIRIEVDSEFWAAAALQPAIASTLFDISPAEIGKIATYTTVVPVATTERGGLFFCQLDYPGFAWELHAILSPEERTRESLRSAGEAVNLMFDRCSIITELEFEGNRRTGLLSSLGAVLEGDWKDSKRGRVRFWMLTKSSWIWSEERRKCLH